MEATDSYHNFFSFERLIGCMDELIPYPEWRAIPEKDILLNFTHGSIMLVYYDVGWADHQGIHSKLTSMNYMYSDME